MQVSITLTAEQIAQLSVSEAGTKYASSKEITSPAAAYRVLRHIGKLKKEHFTILTLNGANRVINKHIISVGTLTASLVHPREVFKPAIDDNAASIILAHNHPSGNRNPSRADLEVTERLKQAGELLGIAVLDHIIITDDGYSEI